MEKLIFPNNSCSVQDSFFEPFCVFDEGTSGVFLESKGRNLKQIYINLIKENNEKLK